MIYSWRVLCYRYQKAEPSTVEMEEMLSAMDCLFLQSFQTNENYKAKVQSSFYLLRLMEESSKGVFHIQEKEA